MAKVSALQTFYSKISDQIGSLYSFTSAFSANVTYGRTQIKYIVKLTIKTTAPKTEYEDPAIETIVKEAAVDLGIHFHDSGLLSQFEIMGISGSVEIATPFLGCTIC